MSRLTIKQPEGFWPVTTVSFWERFSFYGFRSFLAIYMSTKLLYSDGEIFETYAALMAIMYVAPLIGGYLADRFTGRRFAISVGLAFMGVAQFILCFADESHFETALILLVIGTGYFKPNTAASLTDFYTADDHRRESGFTYYFTLVNAGALLAPICGLLAQQPDLIFKAASFVGLDLTAYVSPDTLMWRVGFFIAGLVAFLGLGIFMKCTREDHFRKDPIIDRTSLWVKTVAFGFSLVACAILFPTFKTPILINIFIFVTGAASLVFWFYMTRKCTAPHGKALWVGLLLIVYNISFIAVIEQMGSTISLFIHRNVDRTLLGYEIPASVFQAVDPLFIVIFGPILAILWNYSAKTNRPVSAPLKFALAILFTGIGILALGVGSHLAPSTGLINAFWLYVFCIFCALAELCMLPVGLSLITKISPPQYTSLVTAIWFMSRAFAYYLGGIIAKHMLSVPTGTLSPSPLDSLLIYESAFWKLGIGFMIFGGLVFVTAPALTRVLERHFKAEAELSAKNNAEAFLNNDITPP